MEIEKSKCYFCHSLHKKNVGKTINYCEECFINQMEIYKEFLTYKGRPSIDQINDKIYLGNVYGAIEKDELKLYGVTHILACGLGLPLIYPEDFTYKKIDILDDKQEDLYFYLKEGLEFIDKAEKIYIHCQAGISRSASFVIAFLMWKNKISYEEAVYIVREKRDYIEPNPSFAQQLREFEKNNFKF